MQIQYMKQVEAERLPPEANAFIISICDPNREARLHPGWKESQVLRLNFDDLCPKECEMFGYSHLMRTGKFFSEKQARQIVDALAYLPADTQKIYVHCYMGNSRSTAVAKYLGERYSAKVDLYGKDPNPHVYSLLKKVDPF